VIATCFHAGLLLHLFFGPKDGGDMFLGVISQKTVLFTYQLDIMKKEMYGHLCQFSDANKDFVRCLGQKSVRHFNNF
jgi:hypothetical protein